MIAVFRCDHTLVEKKEKSSWASAEEQMSSVELEDIAMQRGVGKFKMGDVGWLLAEYINGHDAAKGMGDEMDTAVLLETWIILAPKTINTIRFSYYRFDHLWLVV